MTVPIKWNVFHLTFPHCFNTKNCSENQAEKLLLNEEYGGILPSITESLLILINHNNIIGKIHHPLSVLDIDFREKFYKLHL